MNMKNTRFQGLTPFTPFNVYLPLPGSPGIPPKPVDPPKWLPVPGLKPSPAPAPLRPLPPKIPGK